MLSATRTRAWLALALPALLAHLSGRKAKRSELGEIRHQLIDMSENVHIAIVTTAAVPWMTGTAVNPLLRAAYLGRLGYRVTLVLPWLHPSEQVRVFPGGLTFGTPDEQEAHVREWLEGRGRMSRAQASSFKIKFYAARYDADRGSILPLGDITRVFAPDEADICVLEEPEHLTWYHSGHNWRHRFKLVVGVVHTNYIYYAKMYLGSSYARVLRQLNIWMCGAYCDRVIKLSDTIQPLPRAVVCNVHGVRASFLDVGRRAASPLHRWKKGAYFLGKVLWAKGHRLLLEYLTLQRELGLEPTHVDVYGGGDDLPAIEAAVAEGELDVAFFRPTDHSGPELRGYKVFVNPSQSEVLSTTTAEALAMGKFVIIERHPSNEFFLQFRNTLAYDTPQGFLAALDHALRSQPEPLSAEERRALSWEGATERFIGALSNCTQGNLLPTLADHTTRWVHASVQRGGPIGDMTRYASGAGPVARQAWLSEANAKQLSEPEIVERSLSLSPPAGES